MPPRRASRSSFGGEAAGSAAASKASRSSRGSKDGNDNEEGKGRGSFEDTFIKPTNDAAAKAARESRRSRASQNFAFAGEAMRASMNDLICEGHGVTSDTTPHEKMEKVMIMAKGGGMSTEEIFKFFDKNGDGNITADEFASALTKLGPDIFRCTDDEINTLVAEFDDDGNGEVSMEEFKNWCYQISALSWKAERIRLRDAGEFTTFNDAGPPAPNIGPPPPASAISEDLDRGMAKYGARAVDGAASPEKRPAYGAAAATIGA